MLVLYVLSAYIGRMYLEVKGRPPYIVMERVESHDARGTADMTPTDHTPL